MKKFETKRLSKDRQALAFLSWLGIFYDSFTCL